jgi:hypothetical protein
MQRRAETEAIGEQIAELAAQIHAATFRLLELVREFDERGGGGDGFLSCARWLSWRTGIGANAAREKVRIAHALPELPKASQSFREGKISYSKARAITRVATDKTEEKLWAGERSETSADDVSAVTSVEDRTPTPTAG